MTGGKAPPADEAVPPGALPEPRLPSTARRRLWHGLLGTALYQVLLGATSIILVPLFLRAWGPVVYGKWLAITAVVGYLILLDFGGQHFIGNLLAKSHVSGDDKSFKRVLAEGLSLSVAIAFVGFGLLAVALLVIWMFDIGRLHPFDYVVLALMATAFLQTIPAGVYFTVYRAVGQYPRGVMVSNILRATTLVLLIAALWVRVSPPVYALCYLVGALLITFGTAWDVRRTIPKSRDTNVGLATARDGRIHLKGSLQFWQLALSNAMNQQGVVLVVGATMPSTMVATYVTHRTASSLVGYVGTIALPPFWTEFSYLDARRDVERVARISKLSIKCVMLCTGLFAILVWACLPTVYPAWTRDELPFDRVLLGIMLVQWIFQSGWATCTWSLMAANRHQRVAFWYSVNAVLTIALAIPGALLWGLPGVAIASLTADLVCGAATMPRLAARHIGITSGTLYRAMGQALAVLVVPAILLSLLASATSGLPLLVAVAGGWLLLAYPVVRIALTREERGWLRGTRRLQAQTTG